MDWTAYKDLRKQLLQQGWMARSDWHGWMVSIIELTQLAATLWLLSEVALWSLWFWLLQFWLGISLFRLFVLVHECGHGTLFASKRLNRWMGRLFGVLALVPADNWRTVHFQHHIWVGVVDKDPTSAGILDVKKYSPALRSFYNLLWKLRLPLAAIGGLFKVFWLYPWTEYRAGRRSQARAGLLAVGLTLLPWLMLGYWLGAQTLLFYAGPALVLFYVWFECINLTHHAGLYKHHSDSHPHAIPLHQQAAYCRTARMPGWLSLLTCYHFNLHTEHHLFPSVPWHRLPDLKTELEHQRVEAYIEVDFLDHMRTIRRADPFVIFIDTAPEH